MFHVGMDTHRKQVLEALADREIRNAEYLARKERMAVAERDGAAARVAEVIAPGTRVLDEKHQHQFSFDTTPGWEERTAAKLKRMMNEGTILAPCEVILHATHEEKVYENEVELHALANGEYCIRCHNPQPKDAHEHKRLMRRLKDATGYTVPGDRKESEFCPYCGGDVASQNREAAA